MHLPSFRVDKFHLKQHTRNNASINEIRHNQNKYKYVKTITYKKHHKINAYFFKKYDQHSPHYFSYKAYISCLNQQVLCMNVICNVYAYTMIKSIVYCLSQSPTQK